MLLTNQEEFSKGSTLGSERLFDAPVRQGVARNGLLRQGHPGTYGRARGRGQGAAVSFAGTSPSTVHSSNGAVPEQAMSGDDKLAELAPLVGSLAVAGKREQVEDLTVLCALRQSCVMLTPDTSLTEALQVRTSCRLHTMSVALVDEHVYVSLH